MSDLGSSYPIQVKAMETKEMKLKWLQTSKQERISKIVHWKQAIEDLLKGKIPEIERQILHAEQELAQFLEHEKLVQNSTEVNEIQ
jgi:hypothetical protein